MSTPEFPSSERKVDKAIDKIESVLRTQFEQHFDEEEPGEDIEVLEKLISYCEKIKNVQEEGEEKAVRELLQILENNELVWFNWTPRFSELVLHEAGYEQASLRYAEDA